MKILSESCLHVKVFFSSIITQRRRPKQNNSRRRLEKEILTNLLDSKIGALPDLLRVTRLIIIIIIIITVEAAVPVGHIMNLAPTLRQDLLYIYYKL